MTDDGARDALFVPRLVKTDTPLFPTGIALFMLWVVQGLSDAHPSVPKLPVANKPGPLYRESDFPASLRICGGECTGLIGTGAWHVGSNGSGLCGGGIVGDPKPALPLPVPLGCKSDPELATE